MGSLLQRPRLIHHSVRAQNQLNDRELIANVAEELGIHQSSDRRNRGNELSPEGGSESVYLVESSGIVPRGAELVDLPDGGI
jgi:hypothetical protein